MLRFWVSSLRGGVGACSAGDGTTLAEESPPRGPRGSRAPSTLSSRVGCAPTFRAGVFLEAAVLGVAGEGSDG